MDYGQFCPIAKSTEILGDRWTLLIVRELLMSAMRFSELQRGRFQSRVDDLRKVWKLSSMDVESYKRWYQYSKARDRMLEATDWSGDFSSSGVDGQYPWKLGAQYTSNRH